MQYLTKDILKRNLPEEQLRGLLTAVVGWFHEASPIEKTGISSTSLNLELNGQTSQFVLDWPFNSRLRDVEEIVVF